VTHAADLIRAIASLAWPVAAILAVLLFRRQIARLLSTGVRRAKAGPFEMEWERQASEVEAEVDTPPPPMQLAPPTSADAFEYVSEDLRPLAERAPYAAIMEAYAILEQRLRETLVEANIEPEPDVRIGAARLARIALKAGLISDEDARAIQGVGVLRNMAAHRTSDSPEISTDRAIEYLSLIDAILYALASGRARRAAG
jgi:hypothetical protein